MFITSLRHLLWRLISSGRERNGKSPPLLMYAFLAPGNFSLTSSLSC
ncbi:hypothetical protein HanXRQr2_Chr02g0071411 [Helianthus annuus]|uniref:Uncharacterized protein n=1 Tax=Helianthus annuus TaxID=4232 RepID=A0A9K3P0J5_HELAN|nr:hypothetical protein HanXRQr2_Chr02g0071411 [Helianthus annuus]